MEETLEETWIILSPLVLPVAGALLVLAGLSLILWSDVLVTLLAGILGILVILLGIGFLAGGHLVGRNSLPQLLLFIAGFLSLMMGILAFLRRDLVFDLVLSFGAGLVTIAGILLLLLGSILSVRGWARRLVLGGGIVLFIAGIALFIFPTLVARILLSAMGTVIAGAGFAAFFSAFLPGRELPHRR
jgi:hypothetical protein